MNISHQCDASTKKEESILYTEEAKSIFGFIKQDIYSLNWEHVNNFITVRRPLDEDLI